MNKQNYAVCCYTCQHNGKETCKGCNTTLNGENKPYENWELREDLCQKDKKIADLQHKLEVAEKALELACNEELRSFGEYDEDYGYEKQFQMLKDQYKEQAEKEVKGENGGR